MLELRQFGISLIAFVVLDLIWLGGVVKDFNLRQLREIGRIENGAFSVLYAPAAVVYLLMALAVTFFVLPRVAVGATSGAVFATGAVMGLIVYGVFDLTNLAILRNYPFTFALADMAWGAFVFGAVTLIAAKLTR